MKVLIFAGTKNGRELALRLAASGYKVCVSSVSAYGANLIDKHQNIRVEYGEKDMRALEDFIKGYEPDLVIDSTHPYAEVISESLLSVCHNVSIKLIRFERASSIPKDIGRHFDSMSSVCSYLKNTTGNILFTTGINEIPSIVKVILTSRIHVRVIPVERSMKIAKDSKLNMDQVVMKKPPFTTKENINYILDNNIKYLITKDSGRAGNTDEKLAAVKATGIELLVVDRPQIAYDTVYFSIEEIMMILERV